MYAAIESGASDRAAALSRDHVASGRETSIAQASRWSAPDVDPEAIAARRRRRKPETGAAPAHPG